MGGWKDITGIKRNKKGAPRYSRYLRAKKVKIVINNDYELDFGRPKLLKPKRRQITEKGGLIWN